MTINGMMAFLEATTRRCERRLTVIPASFMGKFLIIGILCIGLGTPLAQCPNEDSTCENQVIPLNPDAEYQKAGESSRINGAGLRMFNKVQKVLLYDWSTNTNHAQGKAAIRRMMVRMANRFGFELVINDGAIGWITAERLHGLNVVILSNGERDVLGNDATTTSAIAMENYIYRQGGSVFLMHAAADFISCPGIGTGGAGQDIHEEACNFLARAAVRQYYHHQSGGTPMTVYVDSTQSGQIPPHASLGVVDNSGIVPPPATLPHGRVNPETRNMFDNSIPFNWPLPANSPTDPRTYVWENFGDEWYNYASSPRTVNATMIRNVTNFTPVERHIEGKVNILLALDEMSRNIGAQRMGDHPVSWTRRMGKGLSAYSNIGHDNRPFLGRTFGGTYVDGWLEGGSTVVDSVAAKYTWSLIRYLSRDYEGCMDSTYLDYNPHASVKNITGFEDTADADVASAMPPVVEPCVTLRPVSIDAKQGRALPNGITIHSNRLRILAPKNGLYHIVVSDLLGRSVVSGSVMGGAGILFNCPALPVGKYIVRIRSPKSSGFEMTQVDL